MYYCELYNHYLNTAPLTPGYSNKSFSENFLGLRTNKNIKCSFSCLYKIIEILNFRKYRGRIYYSENEVPDMNDEFVLEYDGKIKAVVKKLKKRHIEQQVEEDPW